MVGQSSLTEDVDALFACHPGMLADPYAVYHRLRTADPVYQHGPVRLLTRYADIAAVLRDPRFSSNRNQGSQRRAALDRVTEPTRTQMREMMDFTGLWMLMVDPPDHTRLRGLANRAFTARRVDQMRERIQQIVDTLLAPVAGVGAMDVIADLAYPLPVIVIAELLGVPPDDRDRIRRWSDAAAIFIGSNFRNIAEMHQSVAEFRVYLHDIIAQRRATPGNDLLSAWVVASDDGERLGEEEVLAMCVLLLAAGHETTTNLIGNGVLALLRHPDQLARLCADPTLIGAAVEEVLRYDSPVQGTARIATTESVLGETAVQAGDTLVLLLGAANRDPAQFAAPDRLDIGRRENKHLSFAHGPHFCLGAALARLEGQIVLGTLLRRCQNLHLAAEPVAWRENMLLRGLHTLPVTFTAM